MDAAATLRLLSRFTGLDASTSRWLRTVSDIGTLVCGLISGLRLDGSTGHHRL